MPTVESALAAVWAPAGPVGALYRALALWRGPLAPGAVPTDSPRVLWVEARPSNVVLHLEEGGRQWFAKIVRRTGRARDSGSQPGPPLLSEADVLQALRGTAAERYAPALRGRGSAFPAEWATLEELGARDRTRAGHPGAVEVLSGMADGAEVLVVEHIDGGTLRAAIADASVEGRNGAAELTRLLAQAVRALAEFEAVGLSHNDLHLDNVLVTGAAPREVKIIDFDLATLWRADGKGERRLLQPLRQPKGGRCVGEPGRDLAQLMYNVHREVCLHSSLAGACDFVRGLGGGGPWAAWLDTPGHQVQSGSPCVGRAPRLVEGLGTAREALQRLTAS